MHPNLEIELLNNLILFQIHTETIPDCSSEKTVKIGQRKLKSFSFI